VKFIMKDAYFLPFAMGPALAANLSGDGFSGFRRISQRLLF